MTLSIYNTLTRKKEVFTPLKKDHVGMYVCGVTVYDYCHLGHARSLIVFDMIHRVLRHKGYKVKFVRNFTDIDDKIIDRCARENRDWQELTKTYIEAFHEDTQALGLLPATLEPCATQHVDEIIKLIERLIKKGLAYEIQGDVFYSVRKFKGYGKLSQKNIDELEAGARVDVMDVKKDPLDFALWKKSKPGEPEWSSPWGAGRPGWHIECSAMGMAHLSETFDIHGGGRDLIFPHHENEIAQSEGATEKHFAKYWVHNGFVNINQEKMSKSLGNFFTIRDVLKKVPGEAVRFFVLSAQYRSPLDYTPDNLEQAMQALKRFYQTKLRLQEFLKNKDQGGKDTGSHLASEFEAALDDDFNTAKAIALVFDSVRQWNRLLDEGQNLSKQMVQEFLNFVDGPLQNALGLFGSDAEHVLRSLNQKALGDISESEIDTAIAERLAARKNKDFKRADEIRDEMKAKGIVFKDHPDGRTTWEKG